jgi:L-seryl-tRNA(Ser) seleniumtransferase
MSSDRRRALPSVDRLLRSPALAELLARQPRGEVVRALRQVLAAVRGGSQAMPEDAAGWADAVAETLERAATPTLRRCVNATGVVLHTNLGRAPLAPAALEAVAAAAAGYSPLEYDLERGTRGSRQVHCAALLTELTSAEDALVVNNAASALLLALAVAAAGGAVVVSRGELIEIGGGFRIPEILEASGARLHEVGTTNRTRGADYERATRKARGARGEGRGNDVRAILKVHRSNFRQIGFVEEASLEELVALGRRRKMPVIYDLGGGLMAGLDDAGLSGEPTLPQAVRAGPSAVVVSGDKLLGGPQAGILVGRRRFVAACRTHPLARAARADKLTLAALAATLTLHRDPEQARRDIPVLRMLTESPAALEERAGALAARLVREARSEVVRTRAAVGGGAFPGVVIESRGVALRPEGMRPDELASRLRRRAVPVVAVVNAGRVVLDVRALLPGDEDSITAAVASVLA